MSVTAQTLKRLAALNLPTEAFQEVLSILAELQGADDARREGQRQRKARSRDRSHDHTVTVTGHVTGPSRDNDPPDPLKEENKIPEPNGSGPTRAELERELFRRGRQVCGKNSGDLIASLLKAKQHDVALARSVIETASTKHDAREYVAAAIKGNTNERSSQNASASRKAEWAGALDELQQASERGVHRGSE